MTGKQMNGYDQPGSTPGLGSNRGRVSWREAKGCPADLNLICQLDGDSPLCRSWAHNLLGPPSCLTVFETLEQRSHVAQKTEVLPVQSSFVLAAEYSTLGFYP